jgi:hypothetical protein
MLNNTPIKEIAFQNSKKNISKTKSLVLGIFRDENYQIFFKTKICPDDE